MSINPIRKEIINSRNLVEQYGQDGFYKRSYYLSLAWKLYKKKFYELYGVMYSDLKDSLPPSDDLIFMPFRFIISELESNFNRYFPKRELKKIKKKTNIKLKNGKYMYINIVVLGSETENYNIYEEKIRELVRDFFILPSGFLLPLLQLYKSENKKLSAKQIRNLLNQETLRAYIRITKYILEEGYTVEDACRKVDKSVSLINKIKPNTYSIFKIRNSKNNYSIIEDGIKQGLDEDIILDKIPHKK
jgi:hypothetical protein